MDKLTHIKEILGRFYEGSASLQEEKELEAYFLSEKVPEELSADKEFVLASAKLMEAIEIPDDLDAKILDRITLAEQSERKVRRISVYSLSGLAAGLLILFSVYLGILRENNLNSRLDQYAIEDPERAYQEARKALEFVSAKWNAGTSELNNLQEVNRGIESISTINKISSGSRELNLLGNLKKAENITIQ
jgi:hypothetical protein